MVCSRRRFVSLSCVLLISVLIFSLSFTVFGADDISPVTNENSFILVAKSDIYDWSHPRVETEGYKTINDNIQEVVTVTDAYMKKPFRDVDFETEVDRDDIPYVSWWDTIAYFSCPSIGLERVPITYGWTQDICDSVDICMCSWNNMKFGQKYLPVICGHNYKVFSELHNAEIGDDVLIETTYGMNFRYKVSESCKSLLIEPYDFEGLKDMDGEWVAHTFEETDDVLVFTCYDMSSSDYRWGVRLECVEHNPIV